MKQETQNRASYEVIFMAKYMLNLWMSMNRNVYGIVNFGSESEICFIHCKITGFGAHKPRIPFDSPPKIEHVYRHIFIAQINSIKRKPSQIAHL